MFTNNTPAMSVVVNGGSAEENSQLCTVVAAALRTHGFRNVHLEAQNEYPTHSRHDQEIVEAVKRLSPDLFDTPLVVSGESEEDMRADMVAMGFGDQPFAFQAERYSVF